MSENAPQKNTARFFTEAADFNAAATRAIEFSGKGERLATLPDIISYRLIADPSTYAWLGEYTTTSAIYSGYTRGGVGAIVVAHGVGPLSDPFHASLRYGMSAGKERSITFPMNAFHNLESGMHGDVAVIPWDEINKKARRGLEPMTAVRAADDRLTAEILGPNGHEYLRRHARLSEEALLDRPQPLPISCADFRAWKQYCALRPKPAETTIAAPNSLQEQWSAADRHWDRTRFIAFPDPDTTWVGCSEAWLQCMETIDRLMELYAMAAKFIPDKNPEGDNCVMWLREPRTQSFISYFWEPRDECIGRLLQISPVIWNRHTHDGSGEAHERLLTEISCHEPGDAVTLVGIKDPPMEIIPAAEAFCGFPEDGDHASFYTHEPVSAAVELLGNNI